MVLSCPMPENEAERLQRLDFYKILDTPAEDAFDRITRLTAQIMGTPISLVSLVDRNRQWFKSRLGLAAHETPRNIAFCSHAIMTAKPFIVPDASQDTRFAANPLVTNDPNIRFYAGAPLQTHDGLRLGTLCAIDTVPRQPSGDQVRALEDLAKVVMDEMNIRIAGRLALEELADRKHAEKMKNAFIADVNHELRTPLTSIVGSLELLTGAGGGEFDKRTRMLLDVANRNAHQLLGLINDLLDMSKLDAGRMEFDFAAVDVAALVAETIENLRTYATNKRVTIDLHRAEGSYELQGDARRLIQVMNNLLSNAIKFSPNDSTVHVTLRPNAEAIRVEVRDQGPGVPVNVQKLLFGKFVQAASPARASTSGTGLGLSIAKSIVEAHGGTIGFMPGDNGGAVFHFEIPVNPMRQGNEILH